MLLLGSSQMVDGVTVFPDHADPNQFWYLPGPVKLAKDPSTGQPIFTLITFRPAAVQAGVKGGGFLMFQTNLALDPTTLQRVKGAVAALAPGEARISPVQFDNGTVQCLALNLQGQGGAVATPAAEGTFNAVEKILGPASPSLAGDNDAAFSLVLDQEGAIILKAAFTEHVRPVGVIYALNFTGIRPALDVVIEADLKRVYDELSVGVTATVYFVQAGIEAVLAKLKQDGAIKITVIKASDDADTVQKEQWALDFFRDHLLADWFKPSLAPVPQPSAGTALPGTPNPGPFPGRPGVVGSGTVVPPGGTAPTGTGTSGTGAGPGSGTVSGTVSGTTGPAGPGPAGPGPAGPGPAGPGPAGPGPAGPGPAGPGPAGPGPAGPAGPSGPAGPTAPMATPPPTGGATGAHPTGVGPTGSGSPTGSGGTGAGGTGAGGTGTGGTGTGGAGTGGAPAPVTNAAVSFKLRVVHQEELKTVKFEYHEQEAVTRLYAPQGFFSLLGDLDDTHFLDVDLNAPFFQQLDIDVDPPAQPAAIGLLSTHVAIEYVDSVDSTNRHTQDITFDATNAAQQKVSFFMTPSFDLTYKYGVSYRFDPSSDWKGKNLTVEIPPGPTAARYLPLDPRSSLGFLEIKIVPGHIDRGMVSQTEVLLQYEDADGWKQSSQVMFNPDSTEQWWRLRVSDPAATTYSYSLVHHLVDGSTRAVDAKTSDAGVIVVNDPFPDYLQLVFIPTFDAATTREVFIDITYDDSANNYHRKERLKVLGNEINDQSLRLALLDGKLDTYTYQFTFVTNDNKVVQLEPVTTTETIVAVGR